MAGALQPPVIHETFTRLPCPMHPQTTIALEGCTEQAILKGDSAIDARAKAIFGLLPTSGRASFVAGEKVWLRYRASSCTAAASPYAGGSIQPVEYGGCLVARNKSHLAELVPMERALRIH